ncbi:RTG1 [Candida pseudojiufengensis]|uniref:RTG1 n=1 Tax=Candida pseudojiufengensis TaxID=497109 RepID=UPI0022244A01|nr:RTG1 [Candida pseudojiufengensis]KAI5963553.1 RTG1 [Candida pseudojiufengensis]
MSQFDTFLDTYINDNLNTNVTNNNSNNSNYNQQSQQQQQYPQQYPQQQYNQQHQPASPTIKRENFDEFISGSLDIKRQLSQSLGGGGGISGGISGNNNSYTNTNAYQHHHGGISKPHSRRNSTYIRSHEGSDNEQDYEEDDQIDNNNSNKNRNNKHRDTNDDENEQDNEDDDKDQGNERKRRDNINDKIQELLTLIPQEYFITKDESTSTNTSKIKKESSPPPFTNEKSPSEEDINNTVSKTGTKDGKPNKGQILTKSVEYLQYLQNLIDENNRKEVELIMKLENLKLQKKQNKLNNSSGNNNKQNLPIRIGYTSAEKALGEIGVGPCSEEYFKDVLVKSANSSKSSRKSLHN